MVVYQGPFSSLSTSTQPFYIVLICPTLTTKSRCQFGLVGKYVVVRSRWPNKLIGWTGEFVLLKLNYLKIDDDRSLLPSQSISPSFAHPSSTELPNWHHHIVPYVAFVLGCSGSPEGGGSIVYEISTLLYEFIYTGTIDDVNTSTPFPVCGLSSPSSFASPQSLPLETGTDITIISYRILSKRRLGLGLLRMLPQLEYTQ